MLVLDPRSNKLTGFARLFFPLCPISRVAGHLTGFFLSLVYLLFFRIIKALFTCVYHLHIWQVSLQLSCSDTCQIWLWFNRSIKYYDKSQFLKWRKLTVFLVFPTPVTHSNAGHIGRILPAWIHFRTSCSQHSMFPSIWLLSLPVSHKMPKIMHMDTKMQVAKWKNLIFY